MISTPVLEDSSLESRENTKTHSSSTSLIKRKFQKFYKTFSSGISKTRCVSKIVSIANKILKFVELVAHVDLTIARAPLKAVKNITSTAKLVNKTTELVGTDEELPFWKTAERNHLKTTQKLTSFVASILKTFKFLGEVGLFSLAKIGEAIGKAPVLGIISKLPFGIFIKVIDLSANMLGVVDDAKSLFKIDNQKSEAISSQSKWKKRCDDLKEILASIKQDIQKEQEKNSSSLKLVNDVSEPSYDLKYRKDDDDFSSGGSDCEEAGFGLNDSMSSCGNSVYSEHSLGGVTASFSSAGTDGDDSLTYLKNDPGIISLLSSVYGNGNGMTVVDMLQDSNSLNKKQHGHSTSYTKDNIDEYNIAGGANTEKTSLEYADNTDNIELPTRRQMILFPYPVTQEPVLVYPQNPLDGKITEKNVMADQIVKESNTCSPKTITTKRIEARHENELAQKDDVIEKIESISNYYRKKIDSFKLKSDESQKSVKIIKWQNIVDCLESKDLSKIESLKSDWSVKQKQKKYENNVLAKKRYQKILSVVYRAVKVIMAVACIGLFFSGVGAPVAFAVYTAFGVLTLSFGFAKFLMQNRMQKKLNLMERSYPYLNYQTIKV